MKNIKEIAKQYNLSKEQIENMICVLERILSEDELFSALFIAKIKTFNGEELEGREQFFTIFDESMAQKIIETIYFLVVKILKEKAPSLSDFMIILHKSPVNEHPRDFINRTFLKDYKNHSDKTLEIKESKEDKQAKRLASIKFAENFAKKNTNHSSKYGKAKMSEVLSFLHNYANQ